MTPDLPRVTHYGTLRIADLSIDCVVLADETRGYVQRQLAQVGSTPFHESSSKPIAM